MSTGLELLRQPFPAHQVGKLAKGSKAQTQCPPGEKRNCKICGGWHHPDMIHLDFVGHAALTDRLLDADPGWTWEPLGLTENGLPAFDANGGLWIKLTVCGVTRLGYGNAQESEYKEVGSREKECIGDALRNAAMRFGAALELWHKGDLHVEEDKEKMGKATTLVKGQLSQEQHAFVGKVAAKIGMKFGSGSDWGAYEEMTSAVEAVEAKGGDGNLFKAALWDVLDSKTRTALSSLEANEKIKAKV